MSAQMDLLYLKGTGHVLAAFTRVGEPKDLEPAAAVFTSDNLLVEGLGKPGSTAADWAAFNNQPVFQIPSAQVLLFRGDLDRSQLVQPRSLCLVDLDKPTPTVATTSGNGPKFDNSSGTTVTVDTAPTTNLPVTVLIAGQSLQSPVLISAQISAGETFCGLSLGTLSSGSYYALVFVPTYPASVTNFSV